METQNSKNGVQPLADETQVKAQSFSNVKDIEDMELNEEQLEIVSGGGAEVPVVKI
jgi:hypothetical protein